MDVGKKFDNLIKRLGGLTATATLCRIKEYGVWRWRSEGITPKHWAKIVEATDGQISYDELSTFQKAAQKSLKAKAKEKQGDIEATPEIPEFSGEEDERFKV